LGNLLTTAKNLTYLELSYNALNSVAGAKDVADGLMRAKNIRIINLSNSTLVTSEGLSQIIYNLSFSPYLQVLDISACV
jgi:hypothetical protein